MELLPWNLGLSPAVSTETREQNDGCVERDVEPR